LRSDVYRVKYAPYKGKKNTQIIIRNSNEPKYYVVQGHPKYNGHDNGNHNGAYKSGGNGKGNGKGKGRKG
jgi:hypothetical protein